MWTLNTCWISHSKTMGINIGLNPLSPTLFTAITASTLPGRPSTRTCGASVGICAHFMRKAFVMSGIDVRLFTCYWNSYTCLNGPCIVHGARSCRNMKEFIQSCCHKAYSHKCNISLHAVTFILHFTGAEGSNPATLQAPDHYPSSTKLYWCNFFNGMYTHFFPR